MTMKFVNNFKKIHGIKSEIKAFIRAYRDERTSMARKLLIGMLILIYVINPIDLSPDFLPIIGIADDILIVPTILWILLPNHVLNDARIFITKTENRDKHSHHWLFWVCLNALGIMLVYTLYKLLS